MRIIRLLFVSIVTILCLQSCGYNTMVEKEEAVSAQWAQVENVYQRRADLIPNLVEIVKGYAAHEKETLEGVVSARAKSTSMNISAEDLTEEKLAEYQKRQGELSQALGRLLSITENYPDLKANEQFMALQTQCEGTENRISVERKKYNEVTQDYNVCIKRFPNNMLAGIFGFSAKPFFKAEEGSEKAPSIKF